MSCLATKFKMHLTKTYLNENDNIVIIQDEQNSFSVNKGIPINQHRIVPGSIFYFQFVFFFFNSNFLQWPFYISYGLNVHDFAYMPVENIHYPISIVCFPR